MSQTDKSISLDSIIPVFHTSLFSEHPNARFAVAILSRGSHPSPQLAQELEAYYLLRRRVYVDQTGMLSADATRNDGTDRDADDERSIAIGIVERREADQRLVACMRVIQKGWRNVTGEVLDSPLPVETFFSELFSEVPAPNGSLEVSRYIVRHESAAAQRVLKPLLFSGALAYALPRNLGPAYGVVEEWLERELKWQAPVRRLAEPRFLREYSGDNLPILIDIHGLHERIDRTFPGLVPRLEQSDGAPTYFDERLAYEQ